MGLGLPQKHPAHTVSHTLGLNFEPSPGNSSTYFAPLARTVAVTARNYTCTSTCTGTAAHVCTQATAELRVARNMHNGSGIVMEYFVHIRVVDSIMAYHDTNRF